MPHPQDTHTRARARERDRLRFDPTPSLSDMFLLDHTLQIGASIACPVDRKHRNSYTSQSLQCVPLPHSYTGARFIVGVSELPKSTHPLTGHFSLRKFRSHNGCHPVFPRTRGIELMLSTACLFVADRSRRSTNAFTENVFGWQTGGPHHRSFHLLIVGRLCRKKSGLQAAYEPRHKIG